MSAQLRAALVMLSLDTLLETGVRFGVHVIGRCMPDRMRVAIWDWKSRKIVSRLQ
jgi:hypothetical protein